MDQSNNKLTMSLPEYAAAVGISAATAYDLAARNLLPVKVLKVSEKRRVVSRRAVEEWLSGRMVENKENTEA
jgi:predicted DNA-binding transcriptional regulator AlpA